MHVVGRVLLCLYGFRFSASFHERHQLTETKRFYTLNEEILLDKSVLQDKQKVNDNSRLLPLYLRHFSYLMRDLVLLGLSMLGLF